MYNQGMKNVNYWLQEGPQTKVTQQYKDFIKDIPGSDFNFVIGALEKINKVLRIERQHPKWREIFRNRTADQIFTDGFATGCTDIALVFITAARAKEIPTKYIEAIDKRYLESKEEGPFRGHVFAEVCINGNWYQVDPESATAYALKDYKHYVIYGEALDSWDLGIKSYNDIAKVFADFKKEYKKKT